MRLCMLGMILTMKVKQAAYSTTLSEHARLPRYRAGVLKGEGVSYALRLGRDTLSCTPPGASCAAARWPPRGRARAARACARRARRPSASQTRGPPGGQLQLQAHRAALPRSPEPRRRCAGAAHSLSTSHDTSRRAEMAFCPVHSLGQGAGTPPGHACSGALLALHPCVGKALLLHRGLARQVLVGWG